MDKNLLVVLNDNQMSISRNVGGLSTYFSKLWAASFTTSCASAARRPLRLLPHASAFVRRTEEYEEYGLSGNIFEELGFYYVGPLDGHDLPLLLRPWAT